MKTIREQIESDSPISEVVKNVSSVLESMGTLDLNSGINGRYRIVDIPKKLLSRNVSSDLHDAFTSSGIYDKDWDFYGDDKEMGFDDKVKRNKAYKILLKWL
jgi:hypothetical protein